MNIVRVPSLKKYIRQDDEGKYYLIDSDRYDNLLSGVSRLEAYDFLVEIEVINEYTHVKYGVDSFAKTINNILDGKINIGRYRFYRVSPTTLSLEKQLEIELKRSYTKSKL